MAMRTISADDRALIEAAEPVGDAVMQALGAAGKNHDVRVLAIAFGGILGSFVYGVSDVELKRDLVRHWCEQLIKAAGVPLRVEGEQ